MLKKPARNRISRLSGDNPQLLRTLVFTCWTFTGQRFDIRHS